MPYRITKRPPRVPKFGTGSAVTSRPLRSGLAGLTRHAAQSPAVFRLEALQRRAQQGVPGVVQMAKDTMKIGKDSYKLGDTIKLGNAIGQALTEDEKLVVSHWMKQEVEFKNQTEFLNELAALLPNWEKQKVFYPTETGVTTAQDPNSRVRLYSARSLDAIDNLYLWAKSNAITHVGFNAYVTARNPAGAAPRAPMKAHFGDRAHTMKHWNQKKSGGGHVGLVSIDLNTTGAAAINKRKTDEKISTGHGEGFVTGEIGLKHEKNFYSAAIGESSETWDALLNQIDQIELHSWQ